ncbi:ribosomal RNA small subunit methyltransferase B [bacterium BMS3Abin14]|nr:ribosomal RNA small subunit methyltransferase B [bacterium BMS3Abin14]
MKSKPGRKRPPEGARYSAWKILDEWEEGKSSLESIRERSFAHSLLSARDRALVMELTQGVVRHRLLLDHRIDALLDKPKNQLPEQVRNLLRLGIYQIIFLQKIPIHAAVNEIVRATKKTRYAGLTPLVNAVLRRASTAPQTSMPDPGMDPAGHMSLVNSMPRWLVDRLIDQWGISETRRILQATNHPGPMAIRVNTLKTDRDSLLEELDLLGLPARPGRISPDAILIERGIAPLTLSPFREGRCTVQDEGAQLIAPLLNPEPGEIMVDACAAPGGKAGHLAQIMGGSGSVIAVDRSSGRLQQMTRQALARLGINSVHLLAADVRSFPRLFSCPPDKILLDAPCSGTGVIRRHPEGKWRKDPEGIVDLIRMQNVLLKAAGDCLAPGGRLLYSTCSILQEENEEVVTRFLEEADFMLEDLRVRFGDLGPSLFTSRGELRTWPQLHNCDGFYAAMLVKKTRWAG